VSCSWDIRLWLLLDTNACLNVREYRRVDSLLAPEIETARIAVRRSAPGITRNAAHCDLATRTAFGHGPPRQMSALGIGTIELKKKILGSALADS
jgi:hypothetical protein